MHAPPGSAQEAAGSRFAFADTTLLRDTLDLKFNRLFPLADSLRILPDTLRALAIRFQLDIDRIVALADSMRVPVDSVGAVLERQRFNPLSQQAGTSNDFHYSSSYIVAQTSTTWTNTSDYNLSRNALFARSVINITLSRYRAGGITSLRQTRSLGTELGWRMSPNLSLGGRANLQRFANLDRSIYNVADNNDEFQFSVRSRQEPTKGLSSEINLFSGVINQVKSVGGKRGVSGDLNGRILYARGEWLSQSLDGQVTGNVARTRPPGSPIGLDTRDLSTNLRGTLALFEGYRAGLNVGYGLRSSRVESPVTRPTPAVQPVLTNSRDLDVAFRLRFTNDRYINLDQRWGDSQNSSVTGLGGVGAASALRTSSDRGFTIDGRYALIGLVFDARFTDSHGTAGSPRRTILFNPAGSDTVDYREEQLQRQRSVELTISRDLSSHLTARASGSVGLDSYDYTVDDARTQATYPRDQYSQSYRVEGLYTPSDRFNSAVTLEVARTLYLNLTASSSSSNTENRSYRAEWRWNCRLFPSLTATQRNNLVANYDYLTFQTDQNRLSLDYSSVTTLNAVLTPRLTIDVNHNARYQPRGGYNRIGGLEYFSPGDESRNALLSTRIAYTPIPALSLSVSPDYAQYDRSSRTAGGAVPQSRQRTLNFSGGATLNLRVAKKGRLSGDIRRTYNASRTLSFGAGTGTSPRSQQDYWNSSLQFSWSP